MCTCVCVCDRLRVKKRKRKRGLKGRKRESKEKRKKELMVNAIDFSLLFWGNIRLIKSKWSSLFIQSLNSNSMILEIMVRNGTETSIFSNYQINYPTEFHLYNWIHIIYVLSKDFLFFFSCLRWEDSRKRKAEGGITNKEIIIIIMIIMIIKLYSKNLLKEINNWAILLVRYSGPFLK